MKIQVRFIATLRHLLGVKSVDLEIPRPMKLLEVLNMLAEKKWREIQKSYIR